MDRRKIIRAIQFVAKPTAKLATTAVNKVTDLAIPRTKEFMADWQEAWDNDASSFKPTIIQPLAKPTPSKEVEHFGFYNPRTHQHECNICLSPWDMENHCCPKYKCWR